jgi:hypothetical protein
VCGGYYATETFLGLSCLFICFRFVRTPKIATASRAENSNKKNKQEKKKKKKKPGKNQIEV